MQFSASQNAGAGHIAQYPGVVTLWYGCQPDAYAGSSIRGPGAQPSGFWSSLRRQPEFSERRSASVLLELLGHLFRLGLRHLPSALHGSCEC